MIKFDCYQTYLNYEGFVIFITLYSRCKNTFQISVGII